MRLRLASLFVLLAVVLAVPALGQVQPQLKSESHSSTALDTSAAAAWGLDRSDIPADPEVRYGVLPNGMRYAIRANQTPPKTAVARLVFDVGSLAESADEQGIAHFIEHMAFNGSTNVPEGEMVKILERQGLAFGADTNAYTGFDQTGYTLDLPNVLPETIDTALFLLRETASELRLDPEAIDRERGVILAELRTRNSYALRSQIAGLRFTLPETVVADRLPIGTREAIEAITPAQFRSFYSQHYRPDRAVLIIVGDIDPDAIEARVKARFSDWKAAGQAAAPVSLGSIDPERTSDAELFVHPAIEPSISLLQMRPYVDEPDTIANRRRALIAGIGYAIINRRLARMALGDGAPFNNAGVSRGDVFEFADQSRLVITVRDNDWQTGLRVAENELRAALTYGFTQQELDEQLSNLNASFENAVQSATTRRSGGLAEQLIGSAFDGQVVSTPQSQLERFNTIRADITAEAVLAAVREDFGPFDRPLLYATAKSEMEIGKDALLDALNKARAIAIVPPIKTDAKRFAYEDFGTPGTVVEDRVIDALGIRTIRFANNVRLNLKQTDFEQDRIRLSLRIDGGNLLATRDNPLAVTLMGAYVLGGLKEHSLDDLVSLNAGKSVSLAFGAGEDYLGIYSATRPKDLALQMQLLTAFVTDPGYRPEAIERYRTSINSIYTRLNATPGAALSNAIGGILSDNDPRFSLPAKESMLRLSFDQLQGVISDRLDNGAIEIGLVGDFDPDAAIAAVAASFGALPAREPAFRPYEQARQRSFTEDHSARTIYHEGEPDQSILTLYWPTRDGRDFAETVRLRMLSEIIQLRLTDVVREELGASYSPSASSAMSMVYPGYGYLRISAGIDTNDVPRVRQTVLDLIAALTGPAASIADDELLRARKPILEGIANSRQENAAWLTIVDEAQTDAEALQRWQSSVAAYEAVTADALLAAARRYLDPDKALIIEVLPKPDTTTTPATQTDEMRSGATNERRAATENSTPRE